MSLLSLQTVTKIFGGLTAVNEVSFDVEQGSIAGAHRPQRRGQDHGVQPDARATTFRTAATSGSPGSPLRA